MATLFNTKIKDTYQSLLKLEDNTILTTTTKNVTDGLGNASPLYMSTTQVRIGSTSGSAMYWDNVNNRLGIGTNAPTSVFQVKTTQANANGSISFGNQTTATILAITDTGSALTQLQFRASSYNFTDCTGMRIASSGYSNVASAMLQVVGSGSTQATTSLLVQNSGGSQMFRIYDDGGILARDLALTSQSIGISGTGIYSTGTDATLIAGFSLGGFTLKNWNNGTVALLNTANPRNAVSIQQCGFSDGNIPNLVGNTLNISPIYNFVGTWTGTIVRGIYYNPTLTSLVNTTHIALETVTGNVLLGTTSGNVGIGTSSPTASALNVEVPISSSAISDRINLYLSSSSTSAGIKLAASNGGSWIQSTQGANGNTAYQLNLNPFGNSVNIGTTSNLAASLGIKGSGSTSATTSLLVQNSLSRTMLQVIDDGRTIVNGDFYVTSPSFTGQLSIQCIGNSQQRIQGAYGENITFGTGGNTMSLNATEVYVSNSFYGPAHGLTTGGLCLGATSGPVASAQLEMRSTTKGFLPPRMLQTERTAITSPAIGLMVYQTDMVEGLYIYKSTGWTFVA
jgi:hypothetical protein